MPRGARDSPGWAADLSDDSDVVSLHAAVGLLRSPARAIETKVTARVPNYCRSRSGCQGTCRDT